MYVVVSGEGYARVIQFVEQHRIPHIRKKKTRVIQTLGNYGKMLAENPNILEELRELARKRTLEKNRFLILRFPCILRRTAAVGAMTNGRPAEQNGQAIEAWFVLES